MKAINNTVQTILAILLFISGANKFGQWINIAFMHDALDFVVDLINIGGGFIIKAIAVIEILIGIGLLINKSRLIAAIALFPLMSSILLFHIVMSLNGLWVAAIVFFMNIYVLHINRGKINNMFKQAYKV